MALPQIQLQAEIGADDRAFVRVLADTETRLGSFLKSVSGISEKLAAAFSGAETGASAVARAVSEASKAAYDLSGTAGEASRSVSALARQASGLEQKFQAVTGVGNAFSGVLADIAKTSGAAEVRLAAAGAGAAVAQKSFSGLSRTAANLLPRLTALSDVKFNAAGIVAGAETGVVALRRLGRATAEVSAVAAARRKLTTRVGDGLLLGGGAALLGAGWMAEQAGKYETTLLNMRNNTLMTNAEFVKLKQTILDIGRETGAPIDGLANAFMRAKNHAFDLADSIKIVRAAAMSAVASNSDMAQTGNILSQTMHIFHTSGQDALKTMATLHAAGNIGNMTAQEFVQNFGEAETVAAGFGLKLADVSATFSAMTENGLRAAVSGTQLRDVIQHIVNPAKGARAEIAALSKQSGIDLVRDFSASGLKAKGLTNVLIDLARATGGDATEIQRLIPAQRGSFGAIVTTSKGAKDLIDNYKTLGNSTDSIRRLTEQYNLRQGSLKNQTDKLNNSLVQMYVKAAPVLLPFLKSLVSSATDLADRFNKLPAPVQEAISKFIVFGGAVSFAAGGVLKLVNATRDFSELVGGAKLLSGLGGLSGLLNAPLAAGGMGALLLRGGVAGIAGLGAAALWQRNFDAGDEAKRLTGNAFNQDAGLGLAGDTRTRISGEIVKIGGTLSEVIAGIRRDSALLQTYKQRGMNPDFRAFRELAARITQEYKDKDALTASRAAQMASLHRLGKSDLAPSQSGAAPSYVRAMMADTGKVIGLQCGQAISHYLQRAGFRTTATAADIAANRVRPNASGNFPEGTIFRVGRNFHGAGGGAPMYSHGHYEVLHYGARGPVTVEANYGLKNGVTTSRPFNVARETREATWGGAVHAYLPNAAMAAAWNGGHRSPAFGSPPLDFSKPLANPHLAKVSTAAENNLFSLTHTEYQTRAREARQEYQQNLADGVAEVTAKKLLAARLADVAKDRAKDEERIQSVHHQKMQEALRKHWQELAKLGRGPLIWQKYHHEVASANAQLTALKAGESKPGVKTAGEFPGLPAAFVATLTGKRQQIAQENQVQKAAKDAAKAALKAVQDAASALTDFHATIGKMNADARAKVAIAGESNPYKSKWLEYLAGHTDQRDALKTPKQQKFAFGEFLSATRAGERAEGMNGLASLSEQWSKRHTEDRADGKVVTEFSKANDAIAELLAKNHLAANTPGIAGMLTAIRTAARGVDEDGIGRKLAAMRQELTQTGTDTAAKLAGLFDPAKAALADWLQQNQETFAQVKAIFSPQEAARQIAELQAAFTRGIQQQQELAGVERVRGMQADTEKALLEATGKTGYDKFRAGLLEPDANGRLRLPSGMTDKDARGLYDGQKHMGNVQARQAAAQGFTDDLTRGASQSAGNFVSALLSGQKPRSALKAFFEEMKQSGVGAVSSLISSLTQNLLSGAFKSLSGNLAGLFKGMNAQMLGTAGLVFGLYNIASAKGKKKTGGILGGLLGAGIGAAFGGFAGAGTGFGIGSMIGGMFANGGLPPVGKVSMFGEKGPELFVPNVGGRVVSNSELAAMAQGRSSSSDAEGSDGMHFHQNIYGDIHKDVDIERAGAALGRQMETLRRRRR